MTYPSNKSQWINTRLKSIQELKLHFQTSPIEVTISGTLYIMQTDLTSRALLTGLVALAAGGGISPTTKWTMVDNTEALLTAVEIIELGGLVAAHVAECHWAAKAHKSSIKKATLKQLKAYDCSVKFPAVWQVKLL